MFGHINAHCLLTFFNTLCLQNKVFSENMVFMMLQILLNV